MSTNDNNGSSAAIMAGFALMTFLFLTLVAPLIAFGFAVYSCSDEIVELKGQLLEELTDEKE